MVHFKTFQRPLYLLLVSLGLVITLLILPVFKSHTPSAKAQGDGPVRVIVTFDGTVNEADQAVLVSRFGSPLKQLRIVNGWAVFLPDGSRARALASQPGVLRVEEDAVVHSLAKSPPPQPPETLPWGVDRIDAERIWGGTEDSLSIAPGTPTGDGIKVAVVDTGIQLDHPDLKDNIKGGVNTINPLKSPNDDNGHGTHVAGIIAAVDNTIGVIGTAPKVWLYAVKVLNRNGMGFVSDIIEGIQWCIGNGIQVVNMSFGTSSDVQAFHDALTTAYNSGLVLVAAAGNSGPEDNTVLYPAKYDEVIAVSATDSNDGIASFSSRGPEVELSAPGVDILSTYKGSTYAKLSGTSMACPHVVGTAGLVISKGITDANNDGKINDDVRKKLQKTAIDLGTLGKDNSYGYGLVYAYDAVNAGYP